ncbi:MAG: EVE domain-containing protein [Bacteriovoracia bacterium]
MKYWLMKCEPDLFSIEDLRKKKKTAWDGVRNYQARNYMRDDMKKGDLVFFYHSNAEPTGIAGIAKISQESHPDPTQFDKKSDYYDPKATKEKPIWFLVEVEFVEAFSEVITLAQLRAEKALAKMLLLQKGSRLSVQPVSEAEWRIILGMKKP